MRSKQITPANLNAQQADEFFAARRMRMILKIGRKTFAVAGLADASRVYQIERDKLGIGSSRFPDGRVGDYRISYNGRVWLGEWKEGQKPVMEATAL